MNKILVAYIAYDIVDKFDGAEEWAKWLAVGGTIVFWSVINNVFDQLSTALDALDFSTLTGAL